MGNTCDTAKNYIIRDLMKMFRTGLPAHHTPMAMIGVKPATNVLVIGAADPAVAAELALVTGLNGRTVVAAIDETSRSRVQAAADTAGALVDFEPIASSRLPFDADTFDIVVIQQELGARRDDQRSTAAEAARVARTGGRVVAIEGKRRSGLAMWRSATAQMTGEEIVALLSDAGLAAVRVLGESEGVVYVEGRKTSEVLSP
jgi:SAM-dependent methyltransferase